MIQTEENGNNKKLNYKKWAQKISIAVVSVFLLTAAFYAGIYTDAKLATTATVPPEIQNAAAGQPQNVDFATFWKVWQLLNKNYVYTGTSTATTPSQDRVYGAIQGMVASLGDPYTEFFPPQANSDFQTQLQGSVDGVGILVGLKDNELVVMSAVKGTPADKAGIVAGDKIVSVDGKDVTSMSPDDAVALIRGNAGTKVEVVFDRSGKKIDVTLTREKITVPSVETSDLGNGTLLITINEFDANVDDQFRTALREYVSGGYTRMIIDERNNPGGYLDAAVDMASFFVPVGKTIVTEDFGSSQAPIVHRSYGYGPLNIKGKVVILVNGGSASAAEIFAGALQEYGLAELVGEQTYGKGSVQELLPVTSDTSLKVTVARWLTPMGKSISKQGLTPDVPVTLTQDDFNAGKDPQKDKAIEIVNSFK